MYMAEVQKVMNSMNVLFFCPNVHWWCLGCFSVYQSVCWELAELRINVLILHWYTQGMKICEDMGIERKLPWVRSNKHILKMIISGAFCVRTTIIIMQMHSDSSSPLYSPLSICHISTRFIIISYVHKLPQREFIKPFSFSAERFTFFWKYCYVIVDIAAWSH